MKPAKKLLYILLSLIIISLISSGLSLGMNVFFNLSFWKSFGFFSALQIIIPWMWDKYVVQQTMVENAKEYLKKPFKSYLLSNINCGHCGHPNNIEVDLDNTEFTCRNCNKQNGIHVNFVVAAITEPLNTDLL